MKQRLPTLLVAIAIILTATFALKKYLDFAAARAELTEKIGRLEDANAVYLQNSLIFSNSVRPAAPELKLLVQSSSTRNGVLLSYLTEMDKDVGEKVREHNVICRAINVSQPKLVKFLAELEAQGGGAKIKELRLKPAADRFDCYQEVDVVISVVVANG